MGIDMNRNIKNLKTREQKTNLVSASEKNGMQNGYHSQKPPYIYHRVFGYSLGAAVHLVNIIAMAIALRGPIMKDPDIEHFYSMQNFYFTIWNLGFQVLYVAMGLLCDVPIVLEMKNSQFLDWLRSYRKTYYNGVLWPSGMIIFIVFWPIFFLDRNLIFPDYIDKVLSVASNYILHMFIVFPILWDLVFLPNHKPTSEKYVLGHTLGVCVGYLIVLFAHYYLRGKWPYPILKLVYGTFYFPLIIIVVSILCVITYLVQWPLISFFWRNKSRNK